MDFNRIEQNTALGPVYISSMRRYAFGAGLVDEQERLTSLGSAVFAADPSLQGIVTCWLLHYRLSCQHGMGPLFWGVVATTLLRPGDVLRRDDVAAAIRGAARDAGEEEIHDRTANQAATVFLGTYSKSDALGPLGILEVTEDGQYRVAAPTAPPLWVFAHVVADYWKANWGDVPGVNIARVTQAGGPGCLLMMGAGTIYQYLGELQAADLATVQRRTPPFQVNRNWPNTETFLERLYA